MTAAELAANIGRTVQVQYGPMWFDAIVLDTRQVFNRVDYKLRPLQGSGGGWVSSDRCRVLLEVEMKNL